MGVLANPAAVRIRIAAKAKSRAEAESLIEPVDAEIRRRLPNLVMGVDDDTVEGVVDRLMADRGWSFAVAESASGGAIAQRLIAPGSTQFAGARVVRMESLDLDDVSKTGRSLASSVRDEFGSTCGLAVVSDPGAGATVVSFVHPDGAEEWVFGRAGTGDIMQARIATVSLEFVRRFLVGAPVQIGRV